MSLIRTELAESIIEGHTMDKRELSLAKMSSVKFFKSPFILWIVLYHTPLVVVVMLDLELTFSREKISTGIS